MEQGDRTGGAGVLTSQQANLSNLMRAGFRVKTQVVQKANDDALKAAITESLKFPPMRSDAMTGRQATILGAVHAGLRVSPQAIQKANDDALKAAIAESLKPPPIRSDAMTGRQATIVGAIHAGLRVSPQAIQKANDNALAAAIVESLKQPSPAPAQTSAMPTPPASPMRPTAPPMPPKPQQASALPTPPPRPSTLESTTKPSGQAPASSAVPSAQVPHSTAHEQLGIPEGADWRRILKMEDRVLPKEVTSQAQTRAGIKKMRAEIDKTETEMRMAHKKLLIRFHPDKHFGKDMTEVNGLISTAVNQCEKEFRDARSWLDQQSRNVTA